MEELLELKARLLKGDLKGSLAIDEASLEVQEGRYEPEELEDFINKDELLDRALNLIIPSMN